MTAASLRNHTAKDLAQMAREHGVQGWHGMRKEELVRALVAAARRPAGKKMVVHAAPRNLRSGYERKNGSAERHDAASPISTKTSRAVHEMQERLARVRDLARTSRTEREATTTRQDRLVVMVRDPYWLHAYWELTPQSVDRARAALGPKWHGARPVLRVFRVKSEASISLERDILIHGGVSNWYVDVLEPPANYRVEIGYLAPDGEFYCIARSNEVTTPRAGTSDALDGNWSPVAENADRIFAMSGGYSPHGASRELQELLEERLHRPMGNPMRTRYGKGAAGPGRIERLQFAVDAEITIYGVADRDAHVTLAGEPVALRDDGAFAVRMSLPDKRQVFPIVASSHDGVEQRTTIIAVERNTKELEPVLRDVCESPS